MKVQAAPGGVTVNGAEVLRALAERVRGDDVRGNPATAQLAQDLEAVAENEVVRALELAVPTPRVEIEQSPRPEGEYEWITQGFLPEDVVGQVNLGQSFFDLGLIWLANRTLHPFGYAIGVSVNSVEQKKVTGFNLHHSTDAEGITFGEELDLAGRRKFYKALRGEFVGNLGW